MWGGAGIRVVCLIRYGCGVGDGGGASEVPVYPGIQKYVCMYACVCDDGCRCQSSSSRVGN